MVIVEKLLKFLGDDDDLDRRKDLTTRITALAERYAPDSYWFIDTMNSIFEIGGSLVQVRLSRHHCHEMILSSLP